MDCMKIGLVCLISLCLAGAVPKGEGSNVASSIWEGHAAYFPVSRHEVARKLKELQDADPECAAAKLTLPRDSILPGILGPEEHVVFVAVGHYRDIDVIPESLEAEFSMEADTVQFYIPYLTGEDPTDSPKYSLALAGYVSTTRPHIHPDPIVPVHQADSVEVTAHGATVVVGAESFTVTFPSEWDCIGSGDALWDEFNRLLVEYTLSYNHVRGYPFCDKNATAHLPICSAPNSCNSCQYWTHGHLDRCKTRPMVLGNISKMFRELTLLNGDSGPSSSAVLTFFDEGGFGIGITPSCI